jgi:hypothetical protein
VGTASAFYEGKNNSFHFGAVSCETAVLVQEEDSKIDIPVSVISIWF